MTYNEILRDIHNRKFYPVYILMGEETYFIDKLVEALEAGVIAEDDRDFNLNVMYGADVQAEAVVTAAQRYPVMADTQLVMLKEAQTMWQAKSELDKLAGYVSNPTMSTVLVISFKGDNISATSQLMKAAAKNPKNVIVFKSQKYKDYQLPQLVTDYCKTQKIDIDPKAVEMLCEFVGNNITNLFSELEKLVISVGAGNRITPELIEKNIGYSKDFNNFELTNALISRNYTKAVRIVKYFKDNPKNNPTVVTTGTLFSFFQKLVIANFLSDKSDSSLMKALGLKNTYGLRDIRNAMKSYNPTQSVKVITLIRDFDARSKGIGSFQKDYDLLLELVFKIITL